MQWLTILYDGWLVLLFAAALHISRNIVDKDKKDTTETLCELMAIIF